MGQVKNNQIDREEAILLLPGPEKNSAATMGQVLVVEDEEALSEILAFNLQRQGFDVLLAADGLEACRIIGREKPDLILLDIMLPLLNGWEICRMIRSHHDQQISQIPIIMLSALSSENDKLKGYDLGADLYLPKPYVVKEVVLQTRQLIEHRREHQKLSQRIASINKWTNLQDHWQQALFHELRNQLTVISGMADHLREKDNLPHEHTGIFAEHISNSSHYLGSLAENYLLVREVENNREPLQPEPLLLLPLLEEIFSLFTLLAKQKTCQLQLECNITDPVSLHPVGLKIILSSLLENSLKYSRPGGHVTLSAEPMNAGLEIRICDDGPGISVHDREHIFKKFHRGQQNQGKTAGSGLGLYIARTLAQAMGGSLTLNESDNSSCCFLLTFPELTD